MSLTPILVAGTGRSGTTMLMELLGSDPQVAFDRIYPYENRYLSYYAKFALLSGRRGHGEEPVGPKFSAFDTEILGVPPWPTDPREGLRYLAIPPADLLRGMWNAFTECHRGATHYAEKVRAWLPVFARSAIPCRKLDLVRDPRDIYLSANAFNQKRGYLAFGRGAGDSDLDYARGLAAALLLYFENQYDDRDRSDCLVVRYEDLVSARRTTLEQLNSKLGLRMGVDPEGGGAHLPIHMTSADVSTSVSRWKREPVPPEVCAFLESHLSEEMRVNGYEVPPGTKPPLEINLAALGNVSKDGTVNPAKNGGLSAMVQGDDFWVEFQSPEFNAAQIREIWACVRGDTGEHCSLYWRRSGEIFDEGRSVHWKFSPALHWQIIRFRPAEHAHWHGRIVQLRIDLCNGRFANGRADVRWIRLID